MKTIIILTGKPNEIESLKKFASFQDGIWFKKNLIEDFQLLAINQVISTKFSEDLLTIINSICDDETIVLHHGKISLSGDYRLISKFNYKFNCGSELRRDVDKIDREFFVEIINSVYTIHNISEIWSYFRSKPIYESKLEELHDIFSGNKKLYIDGCWVMYDKNNQSHFLHLSNYSDERLNRH